MYSVIMLSFFALVILASLFGNRFFTRTKLTYWSISLVALAIAIVLRALTPSAVIDTLLGNDAIQPWKILVIFFSVAYVAISTDRTGILEYIAYKITRRAKTSHQLFFYFYLLAGALTILTSNDVVILTLTPIILYLGKYAHIQVLPLLFAEFIAANTFSMVLYTGDPTNIIMASAAGFTFTGFAKLMIIPTALAAITSFGIMRYLFRDQLAGKLRLKELTKQIIDSWSMAILSSILIIVMLVMLISSSKLGIEIWQITAAFAALAIMKDILAHFLVKSHREGVVHSLKAMPWAVLPFVVFFFVYVNVLTNTGAFHRASAALGTIQQPVELIGTFGLFSGLLANGANNQPATIFMTTLAVDSGVVNNPALATTVLAIVIATSIGATIVLMGTLAGIMWQTILVQKGIPITLREYMKVSLRVAPPALVAALFGLYLSYRLFG